MAARGWIAVDLDGTLAKYDGWKGPEEIGEPVPAMVERVQRWLAEGKDVRVFTARVYDNGSMERRSEVLRTRMAITKWCQQHIGCALQITNEKDFNMVELWDDRCVAVETNTGRVLCTPTTSV